MKKAVLLDVSAIMYRAFYANLHFRTNNEPTGAVYGFTGTLLKILKEFNPDYVVAAFDVSRKSLKRTELYSEYKAQRESAPEDLIKQISRIEEVLDGFGIKKIKIEGHEADDVIGTVAKKLSLDNHEVYILTGDKDLAQLVDKNINIALLGKGEGKEAFKILSTEKDVIEYLGVKPSLIPDLFGLTGDTSDGIPGVRKIGVKKAVPMLQKYGDLEGIYENLDKLTELPGIGKSIIQNMIEDRDLAFLSRTLATIEENIPEISFTLSEIEYKIDAKKLKALFEILEFKALIKKMEKEILNSHDSEGIIDIKNNINDISDENSIEIKNKENIVNKENVESKEKTSVNSERDNENHGENFYEKINLTLPTILIEKDEDIEKMKKDIENEGKISLFSSKVGIAFATKYNNYYIPLFHKPLLYKNVEIAKIQDIFTKNYPVIGYDIKHTYSLGFNINSEDIILDTLIASHMITSSTKDDIENIGQKYCNVILTSFVDEFKKINPNDIDPQIYAEFMCKRGRVIYSSASEIIDKIEKNELYSVMKEIEIPLIKILYIMEKNGIKIDTTYFSNFAIELNGKLEKIRKEIYEIAGGEFNINSPKQLGEVLFLNLSLPITKKNKTGPSTDVDVLESLKEQGFEIAALLLEHRKLSKLVQTYIEPLPKLVDSECRLHSSFNQIGTMTGRLSSSNPNLQNIPVKSEEGIRIREGFVANKGRKLLGIDYSQIELRVLAEMTEDKNLVLAYKEKKDLHEVTARKIFNLNLEDTVTREQRTIAKIVNFSLIYGKTAFGLAKELKISQKEASDYINRYFEQYPGVKIYERDVIEEAEKLGFVRTLFGRKRLIEGLDSKNKNIRMQSERMAVNTIIQGTAAEIIKKAMISISKFIEDKKDIKLILQVHDELIFEVDEEVALFYKEKIEKLMVDAVDFKKINLEVNGFIGDNWSETK
ncbi:MAG: DNA polymerase I [Fusobacteriaceae bacterium]